MIFIRKLILLTLIIFSFSNHAMAIEHVSVQINSPAPYFNLTGFSSQLNQKNSWNLNDFKNSWLVLYFYPKDFTKGCTIEAKGFADISKKLIKKDVRIVGISNDSSIDHESFCEKEDLDLLLLSDEEGKASKAYDSWNYPLSKRNTFLIDPKGLVRYKWVGVNPSTHPKDVLNYLTKELEV